MWLDDLSVVFCLRLYQIRLRRQHNNLVLISIGHFVFVFFLKFIEGGKLDIRMTQNAKNIRIIIVKYLSTQSILSQQMKSKTNQEFIIIIIDSAAL